MLVARLISTPPLSPPLTISGAGTATNKMAKTKGEWTSITLTDVAIPTCSGTITTIMVIPRHFPLPVAQGDTGLGMRQLWALLRMGTTGGIFFVTTCGMMRLATIVLKRSAMVRLRPTPRSRALLCAAATVPMRGNLQSAACWLAMGRMCGGTAWMMLLKAAASLMVLCSTASLIRPCIFLLFICQSSIVPRTPSSSPYVWLPVAPARYVH